MSGRGFLALGTHDELEAAFAQRLGYLRLDEPAYRARCDAVQDALDGLTGNAALWVLGAVVGIVLGQAAEWRTMEGGFFALMRHASRRERARRAGP